MKLWLLSIGKQHEKYIQPGIEDFTRRLEHYFPVEWKLLAPARQSANSPEAELKRAEGKMVLETIRKEDWLVVLDERGKSLSSPALAELIRLRANESVKNLVFLIGGAYGLDDAVLQRANFKWSLSALTFPHQLVRLILAEQVYRACTILRNEKYHHS